MSYKLEQPALMRPLYDIESRKAGLREAWYEACPDGMMLRGLVMLSVRYRRGPEFHGFVLQPQSPLSFDADRVKPRIALGPPLEIPWDFPVDLLDKLKEHTSTTYMLWQLVSDQT